MVSNLKVMADRYSDNVEQQPVVTMQEVIDQHQQEANANPADDLFNEEDNDEDEGQDDTDQEEDEDEEDEYGGEEPEDEEEFSGESFTAEDEGDAIYSEDPQWQKNQGQT